MAPSHPTTPDPDLRLRLPPSPVLIIGAGVAGLTLAQGLRLHSVPFRLFERYARSNSLQGHRFRISGDGRAALNSVLSPPLRRLLARTAAETHPLAPRYVDAVGVDVERKGRILDYPAPVPTGDLEAMPVDRAWIRLLTTLGIEDAIEYEKEFESYEVLGGDDRGGDEGVRVQFTDGSVVHGRLLVGADGIMSRVRKQLQPDRKLLDLERWVMWGRTPLTEELKRNVPEDMLSWCMYVDKEANVQVVVEPMVWSKNVRQESEARLPEFPDYVYWVVCTAPSQYAKHLPKTVDEKRSFLEGVTENWHPAMKTLLLSSAHDLSACKPVLSSKPDIEIVSAHAQPRRVTLIGDAAHPMSPMGGSGGDTAIRNAAHLAQTIAGKGTTASSIQDFEIRMEARAKDKILHSFRGGQKFWRGKEWTEYSEIDV
ncbi:hypothetical protein SLS62_002999 [Diatrype stigma]|uniref:FAD-binding domain-containing protein n=1 Tax=Diatrype stigma TaxID=117547 RepID=A0AAN9UZ26_9PEZI